MSFDRQSYLDFIANKGTAAPMPVSTSRLSTPATVTLPNATGRRWTDWRRSGGKMARTLHPQRDKILKLRDDGFSFGQIAERLDITRSAVSGVCRRAGLCGQTEAREPPRRKEWHDKKCLECRRPIASHKTFCGPCGWAKHMASRKRERAHA